MDGIDWTKWLRWLVYHLLNDFRSLMIWLLVVGVLFILLERVWYRRRQQIVREGLRDDLALYFIGGIVPPALGMLIATACMWLSAQMLPASYFKWLGAWPFIVSAALVTVLGEVCYYWGHRLTHEIPWLWRFHSLHHSPTEMDWLVNTRAHPLDLVFSHSIASIPLLLLGMKHLNSTELAAMLSALTIFNVFWAFFVHSNCRLRFGFFERILTTPAFHHWHHANDDPSVINKNYSAIFPWVDRLFGTHHLPDRLPASYGIPERLPEGVGPLLSYPFRRRKPAVQPGALEAQGQ